MKKTAVSPTLWEVLNRLFALPDLTENGFALAGGTNLALRFGHRHSVDIDLFTLHTFDKDAIQQSIEEAFPAARKVSESKQSMQLLINEVKVELFKHPYQLIEPLEMIEGVHYYSIPDVAAMKMNALNNRGAKKDFYDLYELLKYYSLSALISFFSKKYPQTESSLVLRSLIYFDDAEMEPDPLKSNTSWEKVKESVQQVTTRYNKTML